MSVYPPAKPLSRREVLARVANGTVYRYADPISRWSAPGRSGYRALVTRQVRGLIRDGLVVEGETRGLVVFAAITDAGRAELAETCDLIPADAVRPYNLPKEA